MGSKPVPNHPSVDETTEVRDPHSPLPEVTDDVMRERLKATRAYTVVILKEGPNYAMPGSDRIIWEHGRRNMALHLDGQLSVVCPIVDSSEVCGLYIFNEGPEAVQQILVEDPGVLAGVFTFTVHPARGFPGDALPA
jgi:hypothetical protein